MTVVVDTNALIQMMMGRASPFAPLKRVLERVGGL